MNIIVAVDKNWAIGCNNKLLVSIPSDMKFFRETTTGNVVVMGRKTLESFPNGMPLKNRTNIVLTGNRDYQVKGAIVVHSMEELLEELKKYNSEQIYVIGGDSVYRQMLHIVMWLILPELIMPMKRMLISRIWMRWKTGILRLTVMNRPILIWNTSS